MIDLVKYIVTQIVDSPEDIQIDEQVDENNTVIITLSVNPNDMGKVIGKGGKIIGAVRELVKVKAIKQGKRVRVILQDPIEETMETIDPEIEVESPKELTPEDLTAPQK